MSDYELFSGSNADKAGQVNDREKLVIEKHQKKLVGYLLSGGDVNYIVNSDIDEFSESKMTEKDEKMALDLIRNYPRLCKRLEKQLLEGIVSFPREKSNNEIIAEMGGDKHQKRILNYMLGGDWDDYEGLSGREIGRFLKAYPTPMDFETNAEIFLGVIKNNNPENKYREYVGAMDGFCSTVYGKKYEYYKAMKSLHEKARIGKKQHENREQGDGNSERENRSQKEKRGETALRAHKKVEGLRNPEKLVVDARALTLNKGVLIGEKGRQNEDAAYYNPEDGLFAVFDGVGGAKGAARASNMAFDMLKNMSEERMPKTAVDLKRIAEKINDAIYRDHQAGYTTGVFGKIVEDEDGKRLAYVSVGDSRIYVVRGRKLIPVTRDEGEGNMLYNSLGTEQARVRQFGDFPLAKGDRIVFCSDGITGDVEKDFIPDDEFVEIVRGAKTAEAAARGLIKRATKKDDRTAIVVEV